MDYICVTLPVSESHPERFLPRVEKGRFSYFWESPSSDFSFLAVGVRERLKATGESRFDDIASQSDRLLSRIRSLHILGAHESSQEAIGQDLPLFVGGYSFGPFNVSRTWNAFGSSSFTLPEEILVRVKGQSLLRLILPLQDATARTLRDSIGYQRVTTHEDASDNSLESRADALNERIEHALASSLFLNPVRNEISSDGMELVSMHTVENDGNRDATRDSDLTEEQTPGHPDTQSEPISSSTVSTSAGPSNGEQLQADLQDLLEEQGRANWLSGVDSAVKMIREGRFEKIVLARELTLPVGDGFDALAMSGRLRRDFPDCTSFLVRLEGGEQFLGASPEWLLRMKGGWLETDGLAGSTRRGATPQEDLLLGLSLLASPKDRAEHNYVINQIKQALANYTTEIQHPDSPLLRKLRNVQHLHTPLKARLRSSKNIHHILGQLHPTPAVGGFPAAFALPHIHSLENIERGWYSGTTGWFNERGSGEFTVSIRSALIDAGRIRMYAGCGIVEHSMPEQEWEETCIKVHPLLLAYQDSFNGDH